MSNKDTDDVLDFINSLPDKKKDATAQKTAGAGQASSSDFLDFLDELSTHEKVKPPGTPRTKFEPRKRDDDKKSRASAPGSASGGSPAPAATKTESHSETTGSDSGGDSGADASRNEAEDDAVIDPIASLSSWWNKEGSTKVSSLWGSLASNAQHLGESTYQLASSTTQQLSQQRQKLLEEGRIDSEQIAHISDRLNSILTSVSQQIKDGLMDKEDELVNVMLVHDLGNVAYLDRVCGNKFNRVMDQVEGGINVLVSNFNHRHENADTDGYYDLGMFYGKALDGEKLCFANLESAVKDYLHITETESQATEAEAGSTEGAAPGTEPKTEAESISKSTVFIAIQPISTGSAEARTETSGPILIEAANADSFAFTLILKDITNSITIVTKSQPFPLRWARWVAGERSDVDAVFGAPEGEDSVNPSEWVSDWLRDGLALAFAVLAQEYVTKRMGI